MNPPREAPTLPCTYCGHDNPYFERVPTYCALCRRSLAKPQPTVRVLYKVVVRKSGFPLAEKHSPLIAKATTSMPFKRTIRLNALLEELSV